MGKKVSITLVVLIFLLLLPSVANAATHVVRKGETLYTIGSKYGVSAQYVKNSNSLTSTTIHPGQKLWVPDSKSYSYTVKSGDSLYIISKKTGVSIANIKKTNNLKSDNLKIGQVLTIPGGTSSNSNGTASRGSDSTSLRPGITANKVTNEELELLAKIVHSESRGEPYKGQMAVAAVVLNRVDSPDFPNTIKGVIFQPYAFTAVADGQFYLTPNESAYKAAKEAIAGADPTGGCVFYWNPDKATNKWMLAKPVVIRIGSHVFSK